jgi:hypothetical protein
VKVESRSPIWCLQASGPTTLDFPPFKARAISFVMLVFYHSMPRSPAELARVLVNHLPILLQPNAPLFLPGVCECPCSISQSTRLESPCHSYIFSEALAVEQVMSSHFWRKGFFRQLHYDRKIGGRTGTSVLLVGIRYSFLTSFCVTPSRCASLGTSGLCAASMLSADCCIAVVIFGGGPKITSEILALLPPVLTAPHLTVRLEQTIFLFRSGTCHTLYRREVPDNRQIDIIDGWKSHQRRDSKPANQELSQSSRH